jgi:hypothetical protein
MHQRNWDVVLIGRLAGVGIIFGGIALSGWNAIDYPDFGFDETRFKTLVFLSSSLDWVYRGLVVVVAAEIVNWIKPRQPVVRLDRLDAVTVSMVAGVLIVVLGPVFSVWRLIEYDRLGAFNVFLTTFGWQDLFGDVLHWLFAGLLVVLLAGIAHRLRRRGGWRLHRKGAAS